MPRVQGLSALEDQAIAGVIMWVPGSLAFVLQVLWIVATMMVTREPDRVGTAQSDGCQSVHPCRILAGNGAEAEPVRGDRPSEAE